ncbi:hypothetical protein [Micromonospora sp. NPDC006431]|uniref:LppU/SCO3897 family protein n=1 Tax=Micromonospora sp. NPDC006431 TaxID=3364235 RepID=UPI0036CA5152
MTSEAPNRPGQEPGEASSGAGGPAPYGDRPAQQGNGYGGAPDLGWAPPPPAGRPAPSAPAWGAPDDQPAAWAPPGGQAAGRATAQVPPPAEGWGGPAQPGWGAQEQATPDWTAAPQTASQEQGAPAWAAGPSNASAEPGPPAWGAAPGGPAWAAAAPPAGSPGEQPAWAQSGEAGARGAASVPAPATAPHEAWATGQQDDNPARSDGWPAAASPQDDRSGGWAVGTGAQQQDDPNRSGGWGTAPQEDQPAWGQPGEHGTPAWSPAEPPARAAAKVSVPGVPAENAWPGQDDPARSGGWDTGAAAPHDDNPDRSGGWAAGRATEAGQQPGWASAAVPPPGDRPESGAWPSAESPARASASVPSPDSPAWGDNQDGPASWTPERPAIPDAAPWAPGEAWGRAAEAQPEESPIYQPAPGPGISPANAVPLPPQEQRVPGAALAAAPPADYVPPAQFAPTDRDPYEAEQSGGWGAPESAHDEHQSPAGPVVPGPRTSPEAGGHVSASASVPVTSRVTPPADQALHTAGVPAPQPRVYGRPTRPEPEEAPGADGFPEPGPRFDEHGPLSRTDEPDRPHGFAAAPPVPSAPPSSPAAPPPFPPGVPSFANPPGSTRPVNGVHPQNDGHAGGQHDPYGAPGGHPDPYGAPGGHPDPYGAPGGHPDPFGGTGPSDPYGGPGGPHDPFGGSPAGPGDPYAPGGGRAAVAAPGQGPMGEPGPGGFPPPFPPPPQQAPPAWQQGPANEPEQGRFDAFKPEAEPKTEAPTPKVRNGRVLAAVLIAAVLILAVPLGLLTLLGKIGGDDKPAPFNPAVGACIKQSGTGAADADCAEPGAFKVLSKVDSKDQCAEPTQPHVELQGVEGNRVLCLKPAGK